MNFITKFTKWYYRKGYRMEWEPCDYADCVGRMIFTCPWWVKPLVKNFFSPVEYYREEGYLFAEAMDEVEVHEDDYDEYRLENTQETP